MQLYPASLFICILFIVTTLNVGLALNAWTLRRSLDELGISYAVAVGIASQGLAGLLVWILPFDIRIVATALIVVVNGSALVAHIRRPPGRIERGASFGLLIWISLSLVLLVAAQAPIPQPRSLPDGPYGYKRWTLPVRVQVMTGDLPADNALPAFVAEYMARRVSFAEVRPIMPGQEVANRPILQALVFLPFRAMFTHNNERPDPYPTYTYVGQTWPDTSVLVSDKTFANFLAVAIPCNAALLLGLGALLALFEVPYPRTVLVCFGALSPYLIEHAIFTWPKNLAAFYIVTAAVLLEKRSSVAAAALLIALAYLSHPFAIAFDVCFMGLLGIILVLRAIATTRFPVQDPAFAPRQLLLALAVLVLVVAPWYVWTLGVLHQSSDMLAQNMGASQSLAGMVWIRIVLYANLLYPLDLRPTFSAHEFSRSFLIHLASAIGVVPLLFLPVALVRLAGRRPVALMVLGLVPGTMVVGAFGAMYMVPLLHGWQAVWPALLAAGLTVIGTDVGRRSVLGLALIQALVNVTVIGMRLSEFV